jgi:hypothetical protein
VNAPVTGKLGMESGGQRGSLTDRDDLAGARLDGENVCVLAHPLGPWRPDEHAAVGAAGQSRDGQVALERVHLAAERVPPDGHVDRAERFLAARRVRKPAGEHDHSRAGAEDRHPGGDPLAQRAGQAADLGQLPNSGGLAAREDQPGRLVQLGQRAYCQRAGSCLFQSAQVLGHIPLERQHPHHWWHVRRVYQPRPA